MRPARANMPTWREVREAHVERLAAWTILDQLGPAWTSESTLVDLTFLFVQGTGYLGFKIG